MFVLKLRCIGRRGETPWEAFGAAAAVPSLLALCLFALSFVSVTLLLKRSHTRVTLMLRRMPSALFTIGEDTSAASAEVSDWAAPQEELMPTPAFGSRNRVPARAAAGGTMVSWRAKGWAGDAHEPNMLAGAGEEGDASSPPTRTTPPTAAVRPTAGWGVRWA